LSFTTFIWESQSCTTHPKRAKHISEDVETKKSRRVGWLGWKINPTNAT